MYCRTKSSGSISIICGIFSFSAKPGDYLYVLAWDGLDPFRSWIGEFQLADGVSLVSNSTNWEYAIVSGINPLGGDVPSLTELMSKIASTTWTTPHAVGSNGTAPWGTIPGISSSARFLDWPNSNTDSALFRTSVAVVPDSPPTSVPKSSSALSILAFGVFGVTALRKRKTQLKAIDSTSHS